MKIAYSFGIVDILHYGHIRTLLAAKKHADMHVFGLVSDEAALGWLGTVVSDYTERLRVLEQVNCIDSILFQKNLDPTVNLRKLHSDFPDAEIILYHGNDWKILPAAKYLESIGGRIVFTEYYKKMSPENILRILEEQASTDHLKSNLVSTKANTLHELESRLKLSYIEKITIVTAGEFQAAPHMVYENLYRRYGGKRIAVRSSSSSEDCYESSNAGHYESVLNVDSSNEAAVAGALKRVVGSYVRDMGDILSEQILVQAMTEDVRTSGVVFTRDINANLPYYLINYDESGSTDSVTGGLGGCTMRIARDVSTASVSECWRGLIAAVREIEELLENMVLDIEFAIRKDNQVVIFQVRPLAANYRFMKKVDDQTFFAIRDEIKRHYGTSINRMTGRPMFLSDMAFWNPAEIIGDNPKNLDYSLYREIITKRAWNEGLVPMGYRSISEELMYRIGNKPYISLEYSFLALMPSAIDKNLAEKLLRYYEKKLKSDLTAHDKIEFEIVLSCYDFKTDEEAEKLLEHGFSLEETEAIKAALFDLTKDGIVQYGQVLEKDRESLKILQERRKKIEVKALLGQENVWQLLKYFSILLGDIQKYGTPQFSRQARYAFIAKALCTTMVSKGYFAQKEMDRFFAGLHTVASDFERDFVLYTTGHMGHSEFYEKYGHLRSGTYDIRTDRYDKMKFEASAFVQKELSNTTKPLAVLDETILADACHKIGFGITGRELAAFIKTALEEREYFKFEFTKSLSLAIEILALIGQKLGIDRRRLSYLEITDILASEYYGSEALLGEFWNMIIDQRRQRYKEFSKIILPEVLMDEKDIDQVPFGESRPNFITGKVLEADTALLGRDSDIEGKIVVVSKADPGYDWIFTKGIAGLVTEYGGAASHMAIRCAEFSIPAAIGCGKKMFQEISEGKRLRLDCKDRKLIMIR